MLSCIHDSEVVAYSADSRSKQLVLFLEPGSGSATGPFRVLFRNVIAHHFPYPLMPSIVFSLEEIPVLELLHQEQANLAEGARQCGWPGQWYSSLEGAVSFCQAAGIKAFELQQSYGMSGWVLASSVEKINGT